MQLAGRTLISYQCASGLRIEEPKRQFVGVQVLYDHRPRDVLHRDCSSCVCAYRTDCLSLCLFVCCASNWKSGNIGNVLYISTCDIETLSLSRGQVTIITYSECLSTAYLTSMQSACAVLCCHRLPVRVYHIFPHYVINCRIFGGENLLNIEIYIYIFFNFFCSTVRNISDLQKKLGSYYKCVWVL